MGTSQGEMLVQKFWYADETQTHGSRCPLAVLTLERNGPSGTYSQLCTSRALQSLSSTAPKMRSRAAAGERRVPSGVAGPPMTKPSSSS